MKMLFSVFLSIHNLHEKYNITQSDPDLSFPDENTSFTLAFNSTALIIYSKFWKLKALQEYDKYVLFV